MKYDLYSFGECVLQSKLGYAIVTQFIFVMKTMPAKNHIATINQNVFGSLARLTKP